MQHVYKTKGTCANSISFELDGDKVINISFHGGCSGNLKGIAILAEGMEISELKKKLKGIRCGFKSTSCPDQLAIALEALNSTP